MRGKQQIIVLDVDTGVDDALAIILAHRWPLAHVLAIGTVSGNVSASQAATNTLKTLEALGASTPVAIGAATPLTRPTFTFTDIHGIDGLGDASLPNPARTPSEEHAVDQLLRCVHEYPGQISLFASGPLTNLGLALQRDPTVARLIKEVVIMGGAVASPGNVSAVAEANIHNDPEAAELVFTAPWPITLVSLDVTMHARLDGRQLVQLRASQRPIATFVTHIMEHYVEVYSRRFGTETLVPHDALAMALLLDPTLAAQTLQLDIHVETRGELTTGMTVVDCRPLIGPGYESPAHPVNIPQTVDAVRFTGMLMDALLL